MFLLQTKYIHNIGMYFTNTHCQIDDLLFQMPVSLCYLWSSSLSGLSSSHSPSLSASSSSSRGISWCCWWAAKGSLSNCLIASMRALTLSWIWPGMALAPPAAPSSPSSSSFLAGLRFLSPAGSWGCKIDTSQRSLIFQYEDHYDNKKA